MRRQIRREMEEALVRRNEERRKDDETGLATESEERQGPYWPRAPPARPRDHRSIPRARLDVSPSTIPGRDCVMAVRGDQGTHSWGPANSHQPCSNMQNYLLNNGDLDQRSFFVPFYRYFELLHPYPGLVLGSSDVCVSTPTGPHTPTTGITE